MGPGQHFFKLKEMLDKSSLRRLVLQVKPKNVMQQIFTVVPESIHNLHILLPELRSPHIRIAHIQDFYPRPPVTLVHLFACPKLEDLFVRESTASLIKVTILHHSNIPS